MTKTWLGVGDGEGSALGNVNNGGEELGVGSDAVLLLVHAASVMSTIKLSAKRWEMEIRPDRGGRITSLRLDGDELLDQGIGVDQPTAAGFVEGGAFGWDEMVPNLEPTDTLPDHGEAWRLPWEVLGEGVMRCRGQLVPWLLERTISIDDTVTAEYAYTNVGDTPHDAYWCAHPLFKYEPLMGLDLTEGTSTKLFLPRGSIDRMRLSRVEVSWDSSLTPDVAVWMCNGDLGGYRQVAVEPSWAKPDFAPGQTYSWWLRIAPL